MDYDNTKISQVYDDARRLAPDQLAGWLDLVRRDARPEPDSLIVDLGCGTGRFSGPLADRFSAHVIAIDPSAKMLDAARKKTASRVQLLQSSANALPLKNAAADLVFMSMVFHHLAHPEPAVRETNRILRTGGRICIRNITAETDFPHRRFFPAVEAALPSRNDVEREFGSASFSLLAHETVTQTVAATWRDFVHKVSLRAYSTLACISEEEFDAGMTALRIYAATRPATEIVTEHVDWFVFGKT
ncbi:MAG: class I SAM-dependent methyltransferase [Parvularculaceae bacterium]